MYEPGAFEPKFVVMYWDNYYWRVLYTRATQDEAEREMRILRDEGIRAEVFALTHIPSDEPVRTRY